MTDERVDGQTCGTEKPIRRDAFLRKKGGETDPACTIWHVLITSAKRADEYAPGFIGLPFLGSSAFGVSPDISCVIWAAGLLPRRSFRH